MWKNIEHKLFWCKVNKYFLNQWLDFYKDKNIENSVIIATCEVTDRAKKKFVKETKNIISSWKNVLLTWCWTILNWKKMSENLFFEKYPELEKYQKNIKLLWESPFENKLWKFVKNEHFFVRKPIIVQTWCDNHCSFCLSVLKRWNHKSRDLDSILDEINDFYSRWWKEIILTWINLMAWGLNSTFDYDMSKFYILIREILKSTDIDRIRISSIWPEFVNDEFLKIIQNKRIMTHFHISIQSFSNNVLKYMKRHYTKDKLDFVIKKIKYADNVSVGWDIIVWFPYEDDFSFQETFDSIKKYWLSKLHVFPFSPHYKWFTVPASSFPQIAQEIKKQREKKILSLWNELRQEFINKQKGQTFNVLIEQKDWNICKWWTENYIFLEFESEKNIWDIVSVVL